MLSKVWWGELVLEIGGLRLMGTKMSRNGFSAHSSIDERAAVVRMPDSNTWHWDCKELVALQLDLLISIVLQLTG